MKFSGASWTHDGKGFFYSRYDEPKGENKLKSVNYFQKLYYHRVGDPQSADELVYHRPDQKEWGFDGEVTEDGRYLVIPISQGTDRKNRFFYQDLQAPGSKVIELLNEFDAEYRFIGNEGAWFWFRTDLNAPRGRIIAIDIAKPERSHWKEIVTEAEATLQGVTFVNNQLIASYLEDAHTHVKIFRPDGIFVREIELPGLGTAVGFGGKRKNGETFYGFTSFTAPMTIYRYDCGRP